MLIDLFVGGTSAIIARTFTAPLELCKIQKQNYFVPNATLRDVIKKENVAYLWKGNGINCLRAFPQFAINYAVFEKTKPMVRKNVENEGLIKLICGGLSGSIAMMCIYPLENLKTRFSLQTNKSHYRGMTDSVKKIPVRELYNGLTMSILGFSAWSSITFYSHHYYTVLFNKINEANNVLNSDSIKLLSGGLAGSTAISITYPTDLIRRRLQIQNFDPSVPKYEGIYDCCNKIVKKEGILGLYRGINVSWLKTFPTLAIQFYCMDVLNEKMKN